MKYSLLAGLFMLLNVWNDFYYSVFLAVFTLFYWTYLKFVEGSLVLDGKFLKKFTAFLVLPCLGLLPVLFSSYSDIIHAGMFLRISGTTRRAVRTCWVSSCRVIFIHCSANTPPPFMKGVSRAI